MKVKIKKCESLCEFNPFWTFFLPQNRPTVILSNFIEKNKCSSSDDFENLPCTELHVTVKMLHASCLTPA